MLQRWHQTLQAGARALCHGRMLQVYYSTGQEHSLGLGSRASSSSPVVVVGDRRQRCSCKAGMLKIPWPSGLGNREQQGNRAPERPDTPLKHPLAVTMGWPCAAGMQASGGRLGHPSDPDGSRAYL